MLDFLKKLFLPSATDSQVNAINAESKALLKDAAKVAKSHRDLLKRNGVSMQIVIAAGGDKHGH